MAYYLELFNGDPDGNGISVMAAIIGSAARQDVTDDLVEIRTDVFTNPDTIVIASASASQTNISYVALYDAATDGTLLDTARLGASPTIAKGNPVQFQPLALTMRL